MSTAYETELEKLPQAYQAGLAADITNLKAAIAGASESSIIGVGSGGSYTIASLLCNLHEYYTGRVSRPSTPLEIICNPTLTESSPVFLISAEGKNPDIIEALLKSRRHSSRTVHILTNRTASPLVEKAKSMIDVSTHSFDLVEKDGYLATNSLLFDAVLLARTYGELDKQSSQNLLPNFSELRIGEQTLLDWIKSSQAFAIEAASRGAITIIYSPLLKPIATDLESKLAEAALLHVQLADLRSYAHGRHLWLANRPTDCAVLALIEPSIYTLWNNMCSIFPKTIPILTMALANAKPDNLISGLTAQMHLVSKISQKLGKDPGQQNVPSFGRQLYYSDLSTVVPISQDNEIGIDHSKCDVLGARWPSERNHGVTRRARISFIEALERQKFYGVVFDYDGTLCSSQRKDSPPPSEVLDHLKRLIEAGVIVGIVSGRGNSIQECLKDSLPPDVFNKIHLGLYNGGWIGNAADNISFGEETSEFLSHVTRIIVRLQTLGVPIKEYRPTHPYQVSVRFREGLPTQNMWVVIADALRQAGLSISNMVRSKHSVDILADGITKTRLIAYLIQNFKIDPYQILTMGDQGAWPGNDSALLEHRFSLSVDMPSRRLDRGWKLAPPHKRDIDATLWYLERMIIPEKGYFTLDLKRNDPTIPN